MARRAACDARGMRVVTVAGWLLAPAVALAGGDRPGPTPAPTAAPILGGTDVPAGTWRDTAAVLYGGRQGCSGVLVAPTVVLTADHCLDPDPDEVLLGAHTLRRPGDGERIAVIATHHAPGVYDLAALVLARPSKIAPRRLATGWVADDVVDGAPVTMVGFGAVDRDGVEFVDELQQASSTITDVGCTRMVGCDAGARPAGELGAGGGGIDTCPGDSGGPLYLTGDHGAFLVGITSRGYDDSVFQCSEGGIYTRPAKGELVAWVESTTGAFLEDGLHPRGEAMVIEPGATATQALLADDPYGAAHTWEILQAPTAGTATIDGAGLLTVVAPLDDGDDVVVVRATDAAAPGRTARVRIELRYGVEDGGCCGGAPHPGGALWLTAIAAIGLGRRRRRTS